MFKLLKIKYAQSTTKLCSKLIYTQSKICKKVLLVEFLKECSSKMVCPKFLTARIFKSKLSLNYKVEKIFIKSEIYKNDESIKRLKGIVDSDIELVKHKLEKEHCDQFLKYVNEIIQKVASKYKSKNTVNLKKLIESKFGSIAKQNVINLNYKLEKKELYALSFGFNFALPRKIEKDITYLGFENFIKQTIQHKPISKEAESCFKANIVAEAHNFCEMKTSHNSKIDGKEIKEALQNIKSKQKIIITKADKGSNVVILNKSEYIAKMSTIINDNSKFKYLGPVKEFDKTLKIEKEICFVLKDLLNKKEISLVIFDLVKPIGSVRPRLYGLPKIHKPDVPLRPILSMIKSPQHKITRLLNFLLEPVLQNFFTRYTVKDSFTFVEEIQKLNAKNTFMSSFDVKSLFT